MRNFYQYQKALSRALNCPAPLRRRLLDHVYQTVQDFQAENPDTGWPEAEAYLGNPEDLALVMLECEDQKKLAQYRRKTHLWKRIVSVLLAIGLAVFLICGIYIYFVKSQPLEIMCCVWAAIQTARESVWLLPLKSRKPPLRLPRY